MRPRLQDGQEGLCPMWCSGYADRAVSILQDLVAIPSHETEKAVALYLGRRLRRAGFDVVLTEASAHRPNLVAHLRSDSPCPSVMLQAHMDTVPPALPVESPRVADGKLFARGACDAGGAIAAMIAAVECFAEDPPPTPLNLFFVGNVAEETGSLGSRALIASGFRVGAGIVGEPTDNTIVLAHKGLVWMEVKVRHAPSVAAAANPALVLMRLIEVLERELPDEMTGGRHPVLGGRTLNLGVVRRRDFEENLCAFHVDLRILPGDNLEELVQRCRRKIEDAAEAFETFRVAVEAYRSYPSLDVPKEIPLVRALARAVAAVTGEFHFGSVPYSSDGGVYGEARIPVVLFGPGSVAQAHAADEYVGLDDVRRAAAIYYRFLVEFARRPA
ncbi:MAG: M20/M25/M40 family metallo-hydrolase [Planctomycetota bacterium]